MDGASSASRICPAKINLTLAVTGRRPVSFHELISLVAPVAFGDRLEVRREAGRGIRLEVEGEPVSGGGDNLVMKAARGFFRKFPAEGRFVFRLRKRIPVGAGLGGGSSDAVGALRLLNRILGFPAGDSELHDLACALGSDCPFFLNPSPAVMRGQGERLEFLTATESERLLGRRLILCKPFPPVSTVWAYRELARHGRYSDPETAEATLAAWRKGGRPLESILHNDFEVTVGTKYPAIRVLLRELRRDPGLPALMSGSGSACFVLLGNEGQAEEVNARVCEAWGRDAFAVETAICQNGIDRRCRTG